MMKSHINTSQVAVVHVNRASVQVIGTKSVRLLYKWKDGKGLRNVRDKNFIARIFIVAG
jgi:hypothetical protein